MSGNERIMERRQPRMPAFAAAARAFQVRTVAIAIKCDHGRDLFRAIEVQSGMGQVVKRTGDGAIVEFRSVVDAVRCAIEVQSGMVERNAGLPPERRIEFRMGIHLGDVVEENDGDLMGDGVNIAARLEGIAKPGSICLSDDAYRQVKSRLDLAVSDMGLTQLKNIAEPVRVYSLEVGKPTQAKAFALSPRDPLSGFWYGYLGLAEFCRGRLDAAIEQFKRAVSLGYPTYFAYSMLAGAEAAKGNDAEAKLALAEARRLNPQLTIKWLLTETPTPSIIIDGLRMAGAAQIAASPCSRFR